MGRSVALMFVVGWGTACVAPAATDLDPTQPDVRAEEGAWRGWWEHIVVEADSPVLRIFWGKPVGPTDAEITMSGPALTTDPDEPASMRIPVSALRQLGLAEVTWREGEAILDHGAITLVLREGGRWLLERPTEPIIERRNVSAAPHQIVDGQLYVPLLYLNTLSEGSVRTAYTKVAESRSGGAVAILQR